LREEVEKLNTEFMHLVSANGVVWRVQPVGNVRGNPVTGFDKHAHMLWTNEDYLNAEFL
jgi:hypothetical protein